MRTDAAAAIRRVSVIVPTRNEERLIGSLVATVLAQNVPGATVEVVIADDGSDDATSSRARDAGARVVELPAGARGGNPGAARNRGAAAADGDLLVFLDADCIPEPDWLTTLVSAHRAGEVIVGGAIAIPAGMPAMARCDHYCGSYHVHPQRPPGVVRNHTPANLSVRREVFLACGGFAEDLPVADGHEELAWQAQAQQAGFRIWFAHDAVVRHHNRPGFGNLLRRNYRWGYSSLESKATTGAARASWLYKRPRLLIAAGPPFAVAHTVYTLGCWARAGVFEPILMSPAVLLARAAYAAGYMVGGIRWLQRRDGDVSRRPRWR